MIYQHKRIMIYQHKRIMIHKHKHNLITFETLRWSKSNLEVDVPPNQLPE